MRAFKRSLMINPFGAFSRLNRSCVSRPLTPLQLSNERTLVFEAYVRLSFVVSSLYPQRSQVDIRGHHATSGDSGTNPARLAHSLLQNGVKISPTKIQTQNYEAFDV